MKIIRTLFVSVAVVAGTVASTEGQNAVQPLSVSLTAFSQSSPTTTTRIRITNKDLIRYFTGTNITGAQLFLVTPVASQAASSLGNLNAFLRITKGNTTLLEVQTPDSFNFYQDGVSIGVRGNQITSSLGTVRYSVAFAGFQAELQAFNTWTIPMASRLGRTTSTIPTLGTTSFSGAVSGTGTIEGVTGPVTPMQGTVTGGVPKAGP